MSDSPQSPGRQLAAMARLREDVERMVADVAAEVRAVATRVDALQDAIADSQRDRKDATPRTPDWPALQEADPEECARLWAELRTWVATVLPRYRKIRERLHDCWPLHHDALDVITAVWTAWRGAHGPHSRPTDAVSWHRDARPLLEKTLEETFAGFDGCREHGTRRPPPP